jgi:hypothetical protein
MARPMPWPAAVTNASLPFNRPAMRVSRLVFCADFHPSVELC